MENKTVKREAEKKRVRILKWLIKILLPAYHLKRKPKREKKGEKCEQ